MAALTGVRGFGVTAELPLYTAHVCATSALQPAQCHSTPGIPMIDREFRKWRENATQFGTEKKAFFQYTLLTVKYTVQSH